MWHVQSWMVLVAGLTFVIRTTISSSPLWLGIPCEHSRYQCARRCIASWTNMNDLAVVLKTDALQ
eukprot:COSAG02_NODE_30_length_50867_cov_66.594331_28_plen_65_part_00